MPLSLSGSTLPGIDRHRPGSKPNETAHNVTSAKSNLRTRIRASKALLSRAEMDEAADRVFARLEQLASFVMADRILMYHSLPDELPTHAFLDKWGGRKSFFLPRVNGVNLELLPWERSRMMLGAFNIEEPAGDDVIDPGTLDMIVVPGIAYDRQGNRLGRGKGFYDRLLHDTMAIKIGVAFDCQLADDVPVEPTDVPVDVVITPRGTYIRR